MTEISITEVPAVAVIELELRLGPSGDLAHANEHALGLARFEVGGYVPERPVLVIWPPIRIVRDRLQQPRDLDRRLLERGNELVESIRSLRDGHHLVRVSARELIRHERLKEEHDSGTRRSPGDPRGEGAVRKIAHGRATSLESVASRARVARVERRASERPCPWAYRHEDSARRGERLAEVGDRRTERPGDGINVRLGSADRLC